MAAERDRPLVCVVEDEPAQVELLSYNLRKAGFSVVAAGDGAQALMLTEETVPDLIILDWMLPEVSGLEVCRRLRAKPDRRHVPIIMLTARGEESDRVRGLKTGADDYVVKPYFPSEIVERVKALLRRTRMMTVDGILERDDIRVDLSGHRVERNGRGVRLGPTEFRLLCVMMERAGRVLSRAQLLDLVWDRDVFVEERTVDVHIRRLRLALNADGEGDPIRTVRGAGYSFDTRS